MLGVFGDTAYAARVVTYKNTERLHGFYRDNDYGETETSDGYRMYYTRLEHQGDKVRAVGELERVSDRRPPFPI